MSTPGFGGRPNVAMPTLQLKYPMSLGTYTDYAEAQRAVDYLSDSQFPVENCMIVGTELKQVERITGRLTWGRVLAGGALSGAWLGAFVGLIFSMFGDGKLFEIVLSTVLFGVVFGVVWAAFGYFLTRGRRDFSSISQVVATKYEVLVEHTQAQKARELLDAQPGAGATLT